MYEGKEKAYTKMERRGSRTEGRDRRKAQYILNYSEGLEEREGLVGESSGLGHNTSEGQHSQAAVLLK
jgi:hypothetical protein